MVRSVRLHNECSSSELQIDYQGKVYASDDPSHEFNNLTLQSLSFGVLTIRAERSGRYLCFTRKWKLVGLKNGSNIRCQFEETMTRNGYNRYRSVANTDYYIGFNSRGMPLRGPKTVTNVSINGRKAAKLEKLESRTRFLKLGGNLIEQIKIHNRGDHPTGNTGELPRQFISIKSGVPSGPSVISFQHRSDERKKKRKKVPSENHATQRTTQPKHVIRHRHKKLIGLS